MYDLRSGFATEATVSEVVPSEKYVALAVRDRLVRFDDGPETLGHRRHRIPGRRTIGRNLQQLQDVGRRAIGCSLHRQVKIAVGQDRGKSGKGLQLYAVGEGQDDREFLRSGEFIESKKREGAVVVVVGLKNIDNAARVHGITHFPAYDRVPPELVSISVCHDDMVDGIPATRLPFESVDDVITGIRIRAGKFLHVAKGTRGLRACDIGG